MGLFDSLFGGNKPAEAPKKAPKPKKETAAAPAAAPVIEATGVNPEVVAVIAASVYAMMGTGNLAISIKRNSNAWTIAGRQKIMDAREFA